MKLTRSIACMHNLSIVLVETLRKKNLSKWYLLKSLQIYFYGVPKAKITFYFRRRTEQKQRRKHAGCHIDFFSRSLDICKNGVPHNHHELTSAHHVMFLLLTHGVTFMFLSLPVAYWYAMILLFVILNLIMNFLIKCQN